MKRYSVLDAYQVNTITEQLSDSLMSEANCDCSCIETQ